MFKQLEYDEDDCSASYLVENIDTGIVNAFRRVIMADIETHALKEDDINIVSNTTLIHNEILKHRISLMPIKTVSGDTVIVKLNIKNSSTKNKEIFSDDFSTTNGELVEGVLLTILKPEEELNIIATSSVGTGKDSSIYKPTSTTYFKILKELVVDNEEVKEYLMNKYSCFEHNGKLLTGDIRVPKIEINKVKQMFNYDLVIKECDGHTNQYLFSIESYGQKKPYELIEEAMDMLKKKFNDILTRNISIKIEGEKMELELINETSTITNIFAKYLREDKEVKYALYNKKHPLDKSIFIVIFLNDPTLFKEVLKRTIALIMGQFSKIVFKY